MCHTNVSFRRNDFDMSNNDGGDTFTAHTYNMSAYLSTSYCTGRESGQTVDQNSITLVTARILKYECTFTHIYIYVANGENWELNGFFFVAIYPVLFVFCL